MSPSGLPAPVRARLPAVRHKEFELDRKRPPPFVESAEKASRDAKVTMRILTWLIRAFLFLALFGFAINNQQLATVNWLFSYAWTARMVIIVLAAFVAGTAFGVLAMTPSWWHHRRRARRLETPVVPAPPALPAAPVAPDVTVVRDGL
jgi:putative membrane protein